MDFAKRNAEAVQILARQFVEAKQDRAAIIEECARVAEQWNGPDYYDENAAEIAAAIRALKDKP